MGRPADIDDGKIIEVAKSLFLENGIRKTEMLDIARRTGIGRSSLYRHFASREEIAFHIAMELIAALRFPLSTPPSEGAGFDRVSSCLRAYVRELESHPAQVRFLDEFDQLFTEKYPESPASRQYTAFNRAQDAALLDCVLAGIRDGSIRPMPNPELTTKTLVNVLLGTAQRVLPREAHLLEEQGYSHEYLDTALELLLEGIRARKTAQESAQSFWQAAD